MATIVRSDVSEDLFDIVILGGGSGGYACALRASQLGKKVVLIEEDKLGGTCLHRGCIPTKALLHAAEVADATRESAAFGVQATLQGIDMPAVNKYKDGVVGRLYKGLQGLVKSRDITYVTGTGKLAGKDAVEVGGQVYRGRAVVLATGSYARSRCPVWRSADASSPATRRCRPGLRAQQRHRARRRCDRRRVRQRLEVLRHRRDHRRGAAAPGPAEDEACSKALERAFRKRKIAFHTRRAFASATQDENGVTVTLEDGKTLTADVLLVAVGRGPRTAGMGYEENGVTPRPRLRPR
jgi:dihydrolipoamide dehydrogenase